MSDILSTYPPAYVAAEQAFRALLAADPTAAYRLREDLAHQVRDAAFPRLTVTLVPETDDEYGYTALTCPHCGALLGGGDTPLHVEDVAYRWTAAAPLSGPDVRDHRITVEYDGHGDYETYAYLCGACNAPVRLPEGWTE